MRFLLSGLVVAQLLGCYRGGTEGPRPRSPAADSTAWRHLLAPAIVQFLLRDSTTVPSHIVAREPASRWTNALVREVHWQLEAALDGRSVDHERMLELQDPTPVSTPEFPSYPVLLELHFSDSRCTAPATGGPGGYFGAMLVAQVVETPQGLKAEISYRGSFDGVCGVSPRRH